MKPFANLLAVFPFLILAIVLLGTAAIPGVWIFQLLQTSAWHWDAIPRLILTAFSIPLAYYSSGLSLLLVAPFYNFILGGRLKPYRGRAVSKGLIPWYVQGAIGFTVRYTFLELVLPSEFVLIYFRLMGMKVGRNVYLNSSAITDPSLIELGDNVTIGGSANIMAHYSQGGYVTIAPVKISSGATIGLRATIMGGVEIGERAKVMANSFVLPNTKIPAGETWGGIPAAKISALPA